MSSYCVASESYFIERVHIIGYIYCVGVCLLYVSHGISCYLAHITAVLKILHPWSIQKEKTVTTGHVCSVL